MKKKTKGFLLVPVPRLISVILYFMTVALSAQAESVEHWYVEEFRDGFIASINGDVTFGDKLRVRFSPENCDRPGMFFTAYTTVSDPDWDTLGDVNNYIPIKWNDQLARATLVTTIPFLLGEIAFIDLGTYELGGLTAVMRSSEEITIEIVDFDFFVASEYFDIPTNHWTTTGSVEAITQAHSNCLIAGG